MATPDACPPPEELAAWVEGTLNAEARTSLLTHVARCDDCREAGALLAKLDSSSAGASRARTPPATPDAATPDAATRTQELASALLPGAGEQFAHFRIQKVLGRGGMGVVLRAHDERLDRDVALKLVAVPDTPDTRRRLAQEAKALAALRHPNLVSVHEVGEHEGKAYLVMELVDGANLRAHVALEKPAWRQTLTLCTDAARGIEALHEAGFVHRDIKPDNLMLARDGRAIVVDLGLAKRAAGDDAPADSVRTKSGAIVGTPRYLAPERVGGAPADVRSDVYAFAATALELVRASEGEVPERVISMLSRGVDPDPSRRPASIRALVDEVNAAAARPRYRWAIAGGGGVASLAVVAALANRDAQPPAASSEQRASEQRASEQPASTSAASPSAVVRSEVLAARPSVATIPPTAITSAVSVPSAIVASAVASSVSSASTPPTSASPSAIASNASSLAPRPWIGGSAAPSLLASSSSWITIDPNPMPPVFSPAWMKRMNRVPTTYDVAEAALLKTNVACDGRNKDAPRGTDWGRVEKTSVLELETRDGGKNIALLFMVKGQRKTFVFDGLLGATYLDAAVGSWVFVCAGSKDTRKLPAGWEGEFVGSPAFGPIAGPPAWAKRKPVPRWSERPPTLRERDKLKFGIDPPEWLDGDGPLIFSVDRPPETPLSDGPAYVDGYFLEADAKTKGAAVLSHASKDKPVWVVAHFARTASRKDSLVPVMHLEEAFPSLFDPPTPKP